MEESFLYHHPKLTLTFLHLNYEFQLDYSLVSGRMQLTIGFFWEAWNLHHYCIVHQVVTILAQIDIWPFELWHVDYKERSILVQILPKNATRCRLSILLSKIGSLNFIVKNLVKLKGDLHYLAWMKTKFDEFFHNFFLVCKTPSSVQNFLSN